MTTALLRADHISRKLPGDVPVTLIEDVSIDVHPGEFLAITGPSGSGKSSLLYLLGLLDRPTTGHIWLNSTETTDCAEDRLADLRSASLSSAQSVVSVLFSQIWPVVGLSSRPSR